MALLSVGIGQTSKQIEENYNLPFPVILNFCYYLTFGITWLIIKRKLTQIKIYYILIILFDTQSNFLKILAFSKGQFNYPFIIGGSSILFSWLFTWIFIKKYKYTIWHILGILLSFSGVIVTFYGALNIGEDIFEEFIKNYQFFLFSLVSSICFSISTVLMEANFESGNDIYEFFPWQGLLGSFILIIESFAFSEPMNIIVRFRDFSVNYFFLVFLFGFIILFFIFGVIMPFYIRRHSASLLNISLVSQIFWAFVLDVIIIKKAANNYFYYLGFGIILGGIILFSLFRVEIVKQVIKTNEIDNIMQNDFGGSLVPTSTADTEGLCSSNEPFISDYSSAYRYKRNSLYRTRQIAGKYVLDQEEEKEAPSKI